MAPNKSHTKSRIKTLLWVLPAVCVLGLSAYAGFYLDQNTTITAVEFDGNYFTETDELMNAIEAPIGQLADSVNYHHLFESIRSLPYVLDASLSMNRRGTLTFSVTEREPLAIIVDGSKRVYVAEGGITLPVVPGKVKDVPLLYGFKTGSPSDTLNSAAFRQAEQFLSEAYKNRFGWLTISEVAWNDREGIIALSHENGVKLIFGRDDFPQKLRHWEVFYAEVISRKGIQAFESIDLRFRNQIVTHES